MNDRDNSTKGFLERWSRKKIESEREADAPVEPRATDVSPAGDGRPAAGDAKVPAEVAPKPEFDLASLPSLESITATTDIRAFLGPSVPKELARAALRRAWAADPAIRDFKGLAENDWDFTDPTAMPGFGALPDDYDVKKLVAQIFGDGEKPADPAAPPQPPAAQKSTIANELPAPAETAPAPAAEEEPETRDIAPSNQLGQSSIVQRDNNTASHNSISENEKEERRHRRPHGGALPQ